MASRTAPRKTSTPKAQPAATETTPHPQIAEIDEQFTSAGLKRDRRDKAAGVRRRAKYQQKTPEELRPAPAITARAANGVEVVHVPGWEKLPWLWHGFSTRVGGVSRAYTDADGEGELNLGFTADDDREKVLRNRELLAEAITGTSATPIATIRQVHSNIVARAAEAAAGPVCGGDGLMTDRPGLLLGVMTADCTPVLVADKKRKIVAAFHAGWRGTVKRIVESGIGRLRAEFGSRPQDLVAAIGPGISPCCYAVGEDVLSEFTSQFAYAESLFHEVYDDDPVKAKYPMLFLTQRAPGHSPTGPSLHLDVAEANRRQLLDAGLKPGNIKMVGGCTKCQPNLFFSHRGQQGRAGRMMSVIGIQPLV